MSILASLIGILTLMISVSMNANQKAKEGQTEEEFARAKENQQLKKQIVQIEKQILESEKSLQKENKTILEIQKLEDQSIVLRRKLEEINKANTIKESDEELQKIIENLKIEIANLLKTRPQLEKELAQLLEELKKRKDLPPVVESVLIRPGGIGSKVPRNLFFIECTANGILIHSDQGISSLIPIDSIPISQDYIELMSRAKKEGDSMLLFLMRKTGNLSYQWAAGIADTKYNLQTGKLPIPNEGKIDLSLFK